MNFSDLLLRATSVEVGVVGDCDVVGASSLLLVVMLGMVGGAVGGGMGVVGRVFK